MPCFSRQFLGIVWSIQLVFLRFIGCKTFLSSLTRCNTSLLLTGSVQRIFSILHPVTHFNTFMVFMTYSPQIQVLAPYSSVPKIQHVIVSSLNLGPICEEKSYLLVECCFCRDNRGISIVHLAIYTTLKFGN